VNARVPTRKIAVSISELAASPFDVLLRSKRTAIEHKSRLERTELAKALPLSP